PASASRTSSNRLQRNMTIVLPQKSVIDPPEPDLDQREPSFDWPEPELRKFLGHKWNQDPTHIRVIGRVRPAGSGSFGFLEDLRHPISGLHLAAPTTTSKAHQGVFIPPSELRGLPVGAETGTFVLAELELSSI